MKNSPFGDAAEKFDRKLELCNRSGCDYSIVVGVIMIGFWALLFATNQVFAQDSSQRPIEIAHQLVAEVSTATLLTVSGLGLAFARSWKGYVGQLSLGILLYTVINSPGFYATRGSMLMVAMFSILTTLTLISTVVLLSQNLARLTR